MYLHLSGVDKQRKNKEGGVTGKGFKKGQSGNPNGRPKKGLAIADILNSKLDIVKSGKTQRELVLEKVIDLALDGEKWAMEFIADRTEGKAIERVIKQKTDDILEIK